MCPKVCPDEYCDATMLPADDIDCEKAVFVCPECCPDWALCRVTSYTDLEPKEYGYDVKGEKES